MTHPNELINKTRATRNLSNEECAELSNLLQEPSVQALNENGALSLEGII